MLIFFGANSALALQTAAALRGNERIIGFCREPSDATRTAYDEVFAIDYRNPQAALAVLEQLKDERITVVNFAARKVDKLFLNIEPGDVAETFDTNLAFNFVVLPPLIRKMMAAKWGRIVFLSSTGAVRGGAGLSLYATSKAALSTLAACLAKEYGRFGVTANVLSLGYFDSGLIDGIPEERRTKMIAEIPSKTLGNARHIAEAIQHLIRNEYVNGATLPLDGAL
jgi:NAD(P)-dependent dehydrogenase (short-subunit alcohol dehydrogenase family)